LIAALGRGQAGARTLILPGPQIAALMADSDWVAAVETGTRAAAAGRASAPPPMTVEGIGGAFHAKAASLRLERPLVALKWNGNFPGNPDAHGLPTIRAPFCCATVRPARFWP
jgi:ornithine cyclodeaminase/alanine dehydrogenase-like protein (mu-crystallin family)